MCDQDMQAELSSRMLLSRRCGKAFKAGQL
jgi:hypothetical protein